MKAAAGVLAIAVALWLAGPDTRWLWVAVVVLFVALWEVSERLDALRRDVADQIDRLTAR